MKNTKYFFVIVFFFTVTTLIAQPGFKTSLALDPGEPNAADAVAEYEDNFFVSGLYFDKTAGYWGSFS